MKQANKIKILQDLVAIASVNGQEAQVADYIVNLFADYQGMVKVKRLTYAPGRDNLVITIGDKGPMVGLSGHMDVVDPGPTANWQSAPFNAQVRDGKVFGRGTTDMKAGLAAVIIAMLEILEDGDPLIGQVRLLATVGEEDGEYGAAQLTQAGFADGLAALIIAEPTDDMQKIVYTSRGVIDYEVISKGKIAHSAHPELGINAIDHLIEFYQLAKKRVASLNQVDPVLGAVTHTTTLINGGRQVNMVPDQAKLMGNLRTIPQYPNQIFFDLLDGAIEELNKRVAHDLSIRYVYPEEAIVGQKNGRLVKLAKQILQATFHSEAVVTGDGSASDGSEFIRAQGKTDLIICGPGNNTGHQVDEFVDLTTYLKAIQFYKQMIAALWQDQ